MPCEASAGGGHEGRHPRSLSPQTPTPSIPALRNLVPRPHTSAVSQPQPPPPAWPAFGSQCWAVLAALPAWRRLGIGCPRQELSRGPWCHGSGPSGLSQNPQPPVSLEGQPQTSLGCRAGGGVWKDGQMGPEGWLELGRGIPSASGSRALATTPHTPGPHETLGCVSTGSCRRVAWGLLPPAPQTCPVHLQDWLRKGAPGSPQEGPGLA